MSETIFNILTTCMLFPYKRNKLEKSRNKKYESSNKKKSLHRLMGRFDIAEEKRKPMNWKKPFKLVLKGGGRRREGRERRAEDWRGEERIKPAEAARATTGERK